MRTVLILLLFASATFTNAQAPYSFCTTFGGAGIDIGYSVKEIYKKQYVIIGSTTSYGNGFPDAYLILADSMGQGIWQRNYGGNLSEVCKNLLVNPIDSGFVFVGYSNSFGSGDYDVYVVRTDKQGGLIWQSTFGGSDWDFGNDIAFASDGNLIVCGSSANGPYRKKDGLLAKLNAENGTVIWSKYFGGAEDDEFNCIKSTSDSKLTIGGNTKSYGDLNGDYWFFKTNNSGDSLISKRIGNLNKSEKCYDFIEDSNNKLVFCGSLDTSVSNSGKNIAYMAKTDLNGEFISDNKISGAFTDEDKFLAITSNKQGGKYFLSRKVNHYGTGYGIDVQPYLMDEDYTFNNATTYGGYGDDEAFDVTSTSDNGFLMVGYTKAYNLVSEDVYLVKLDATLLNAPVIVSDEQEPLITRPNEKIYYYEGSIYLKGINIDQVNYQIFNSTGQLVQSGKISSDTVLIEQNLKPDIYFFKLSVTNCEGVKFIKN